MFKRSPTLTEQIKAYIKERIVNNEFADGRIPPETELANLLGVSRTTIRDALSRLEIEGVVVRKQGAGTFINKPILQIHSRLEEIWSYESVLQAHGYTPSVRLLAFQKNQEAPNIAKALGLGEDATFLFIEKLFRENSTPVILTRNWIPETFLVQDLGEENAKSPIYEFLEDCCQQQLAYYLSDLVPISADAEIAARLRVPQKTALLTFEEVGYNGDDAPILKAQSFFRDDLMRFRLIRRRTP